MGKKANEGRDTVTFGGDNGDTKRSSMVSRNTGGSRGKGIDGMQKDVSVTSIAFKESGAYEYGARVRVA